MKVDYPSPMVEETLKDLLQFHVVHVFLPWLLSLPEFLPVGK